MPITRNRIESQPHSFALILFVFVSHLTDKAAYEDLSGVLPMLGFDADDFTLHNPLQIDPLDLEELNILADGDMVEDTERTLL